MTYTITGAYGNFLFHGGSETLIIESGASATGVQGGTYGGDTVANLGVVSGGVELGSTSLVTNGGTGATSAQITGADGIDMSYGALVDNYGTVTGTTGAAIFFSGPGSVVNKTDALISGYEYGVRVHNGAGTVTNLGVMDGLHGDGVYLGVGGSVTNGSLTDQTASIAGGVHGVRAFLDNAVIGNFGIISGKLFGAYLTEGGQVTNGAKTDTTATISGGMGIEIKGLGGVVHNYGSISGVELAVGGTITNGASGSNAAVISTSGTAVYIELIAGRLTNYGKIASTGGVGVDFTAGGYLVNGAGGTISALSAGVLIGNAYATISNQGSIHGATGISFTAGGIVRSGSSTNTKASITGQTGIAMAQFGTVFSDGAIAGTLLDGVTMAAGGFVVSGYKTDPTASISGAEYGIAITGGVGTVVNYGSVSATSFSAIKFTQGGSVRNGQYDDTSATITGQQGVQISGGYGAVQNYGQIIGKNTDYDTAAIVVSQGGSIVNGSKSDSTASISGGYDGVIMSGGGGVVFNWGSISGGRCIGLDFGVYGQVINESTGHIYGYQVGLNVTSASTTIFNSGTISAGIFGVLLSQASGYLINNSLITAPDIGVKAAATASTILNYGTISGGKYAVEFTAPLGLLVAAGGSKLIGGPAVGDGAELGLYNATGTITGMGGVGTVTGGISMEFEGFSSYHFYTSSSWTLIGTNALAAGDLLTDNGGFTLAGSLANSGTITGLAADGIHLTSGGHFTNETTSALVSASVGAYAGTTGAATVTNFGTIVGTGGTSVEFKSATDRLIAEAGSTFTGSVAGGGGTLELAGGTGTITGLGGAGAVSVAEAISFAGFGSYVLDTGGTWTLSGTNVIAAKHTLTNSGTLTDAGTLTVSGDVTSTGLLAIASGQTLTVANAGAVQVQGSVSNAGTIALNSTGASTYLHVLAGGATLSGGGSVVLGGTVARIYGASSAAVLTNAGDTLIGHGAIGLGKLTLINQAGGVIEATGGRLTVDTLGETLVNGGLIELTTGATLQLTSTTIDQSGGGKILAAGGLVNLQDDVILGGTVGSTGTGFVDAFTSGGELDGATSAVTVSGAVRVLNGISLTLQGSIDLTGKLELLASSKFTNLVIGAGGASLSGGGEIVLSNNADNVVVGLSAADTLTNVDDTLAGAGSLGEGVMGLVNDKAGIINGNGTAALTIAIGANKVTNAGIIESTGTGGVFIAGAVVNTGTLVATKGMLSVNGAVSGAGTVRITNGVADFGSTFTEAVTFAAGSTGTLELAKSQTYTGTITGLSKTGTNSLDLLDIGFTAGTTKATYSGTATSGVLTVTDGTHTAKINLTGDYMTSGFTLTSDGHGGTKVVDPPTGVSANGSAFVSAMASLGAASATTATSTPASPPASLLTRPGA